MWCGQNGLTDVPCLTMCCWSLQPRQFLSSTDMSLPLILLSANKNLLLILILVITKCLDKSTVTIYLKSPTKLIQ
jgi:hypothetical protein